MPHAVNNSIVRQFTGNGATLSYDYAYDARSSATAITRFSDLTGTTKVGETDNTYDAKGRLTNKQQKDGTNTVFSNATYVYDAGDRLTTQTDNGTTRTFSYDNTNQLTADSTNTYTYDANGNRTNTGYTTGAANQITNDGTWTYSYDDAGNRIKKSKGASAETWNYQYDTANHLTRVEQHATDGGTLQLRIDYTYDVYGNLIARTQYDGSLNVVNAQRYGYDGWKTDSGQSSFVGQENFDVWTELDTGNNLVVRRLFGNSIDALIARITSGGTVNWYLTDRQGSVRSIVNASGTVINSVSYDGYGNATQSSPVDWYLFQGRQIEVTVGIAQCRERWLMLVTFRFMSNDPKGFGAGDPNLTRYVSNDPTNATDPSGLRPTTPEGVPDNWKMPDNPPPAEPGWSIRGTLKELGSVGGFIINNPIATGEAVGQGIGQGLGNTWERAKKTGEKLQRVGEAIQRIMENPNEAAQAIGRGIDALDDALRNPLGTGKLILGSIGDEAEKIIQGIKDDPSKGLIGAGFDGLEAAVEAIIGGKLLKPLFGPEVPVGPQTPKPKIINDGQGWKGRGSFNNDPISRAFPDLPEKPSSPKLGWDVENH